MGNLHLPVIPRPFQMMGGRGRALRGLQAHPPSTLGDREERACPVPPDRRRGARKRAAQEFGDVNAKSAFTSCVLHDRRWTFATRSSAIDALGRVGIPKAIRDRLDLPSGCAPRHRHPDRDLDRPAGLSRTRLKGCAQNTTTTPARIPYEETGHRQAGRDEARRAGEDLGRPSEEATHVHIPA